MLLNKSYTCTIYTLDGQFPAVAKVAQCGERVRIKSTCGKYTMTCTRGTAERKFWNDENPTFYAC